MLYHTDLIVYFWLIPVFSVFFIPLTLAVAALAMDLGQHFFLAREITNEEKRKHQRVSSSNDTLAKITVGDKTCYGLVCNISQTGVSLKRLPELISQKIDKLSVVISHYDVDYNLLFKTKWMELTGSGIRLGAEVDTASSDWEEFLLQTEKTGQFEAV